MRTADDEFAHFAQDVTPGLRRLAIALCADPHRAEDLLQSTLEKMYLGWGRGRIENPAAYARRVLVRTLAAEQRRGWWKRERPTDELPWAVADDAHRKTDLRIALYQALRALPPRQRQAVVLRFLEDLPIDTVADLLGCSPGTVKRSAHDGLRRLRALLPHLAERTTS